MVIVAVLAVVILDGALFGWGMWAAAQRPHVDLDNVIVDGNSILCPGDALNYRFTLSISKASDVNLSTSVDAVAPEVHVSYTRPQQYSPKGAIDLEISRHWILPPTYTDADSGSEMVWKAGEYIQRTTANVVGGREAAAHIEVPFVVRKDCP